VTSQGTNLIFDPVGSGGWVASDIRNNDPLLGPLTNNGGDTLSRMPSLGSPAIDAGQNALATGFWDQRLLGYPRIMNNVINIGAIETWPVPPDNGQG
jgi:hypothetical protein